MRVVPKTISLNRRHPSRLDLRALRRFTWTCRDALDQFDKLRSVFEAAAYTGEYFQNRGLFSDYFLRQRLREDDAWRDNPSDMFAFVRDLMQDAGRRISAHCSMSVYTPDPASLRRQNSSENRTV